MSFVELMKAIFGLLPTIIAAVKAIEDAFPEGGKGKEKLEMVRATLEQGYLIAGNTAEQFSAIWPAVNAMITVAVKLLKK